MGMCVRVPCAEGDSLGVTWYTQTKMKIFNLKASTDTDPRPIRWRALRVLHGLHALFSLSHIVVSSINPSEEWTVRTQSRSHSG